MYFLGIALTGIGVLGLLLAIALDFYSRSKHDSDWYKAAQDTGHRAIFIFIIGVIILMFVK
jgi:hypothetical protein